MKLPNLLNKKILFFRQKLLSWHLHDNHRDMPWKGTKDVYRIWLSEIILQQTRVEQGRAYYEQFIKHFPTVQDLAAASEQSVMKHWEGLGYYSRCKNLHHTAKYIVEHHQGRFPDTYDELLNLKGVGPYTAAAIASFGYGIPKAVVDGNVIRVMARYFGVKQPADTRDGKKTLHELADLCLNTRDPGQYNQAIMDFGATVCKPAGALCHACRLQANCDAFQTRRVEQLPVISKRIIKKTRYFIVRIIRCKKHYAFIVRPSGDIWAGLHSFPIFEASSRSSWLAYLKEAAAQQEKNFRSPRRYHQQLTHQTLHAGVILSHIEKRSECAEKVEWVHLDAFHQLAFPRLLRDIIQQEPALSGG